MAISVLVVDDHTLLRDGLSRLLNAAADIEVVGDAGNGLDAVAKARELKPRVVLMDLYLPGIDGIEAIRRIAKDLPDTYCILLTASSEGDNVVEATRAGARGYILKTSPASAILNQVRQVAAGKVALAEDVASKLVAGLARHTGPSARDRSLPSVVLTERETQVLGLISQGMANKEIAGVLSISEHTARAHVRSLMQKLNVDNRTQLAIYGVREGVGWKAGPMEETASARRTAGSPEASAFAFSAPRR